MCTSSSRLTRWWTGQAARAAWWSGELSATWEAPADPVGGGSRPREPMGELDSPGLDSGGRMALAVHVRPGVRVLVVGCGAGGEARELAQLGARVVGIDPSRELIELGRERVRTQEIELRVGSVPTLAADLADFDVVRVSSVVYSTLRGGHAARVAALRACRRALRPGGVVVWAAQLRPKTTATRWLLDEPRRVLRRLGHTRGAAPGERFFRDQADGAPHLEHVFSERAEVLDEVRAAGLEPLEGSGSYFTARRPAAPMGPFRPESQVEAAAHEGGLLVANLATGATFRLNATGARIWARLLEGASRASIVEHVTAAAGVSRERVERDVTQLLETLLERGLIMHDEARA